MNNARIIIALALALLSSSAFGQAGPPFAVPAAPAAPSAIVDTRASSPSSAPVVTPAPVIVVQAGPTLQEQAAALATVLASLAALITSIRTHRSVNSRMDKYETIAEERFTARATLAEKDAQAGREAQAALTRERETISHDSKGPRPL